MKVIVLIFGFIMMLKCFLVIDFDGNILEDFESPNNYQNVSDDLRNLNDGTLRWTHIDKNSGILNVIKASP